MAHWLDAFDADALREWARGLGVETFIGCSGRVFPLDLQGRAAVARLGAAAARVGVRFHVHHRWTGWDDDGALLFDTPAGHRALQAEATVLALGGASWPELGSDGAWVAPFDAAGIGVAPLRPVQLRLRHRLDATTSPAVSRARH